MWILVEDNLINMDQVTRIQLASDAIGSFMVVAHFAGTKDTLDVVWGSQDEAEAVFNGFVTLLKPKETNNE